MESFRSSSKDRLVEAEDFLPLLGTDHIEFYCGNAKQSAFYYQYLFGFELVAYAGPETGVRDKASYVLQQNKLRFVLSTALRPDHEISDHVRTHGDGVKVLALQVEDARKALEETRARGGEVVMEAKEFSDEHGSVVVSAIKTYGETIHKFVERRAYNGIFMLRLSATKFYGTGEPCWFRICRSLCR